MSRRRSIPFGTKAPARRSIFELLAQLDQLVLWPPALEDDAGDELEQPSSPIGDVAELEDAGVWECSQGCPGEHVADRSPLEQTIVDGGDCPHCGERLVRI